MLSKDLRSFFAAQPAVAAIAGQRIHVNHVPQEIDDPYIWLSRSGTTQERTMDQAQGEQPFETRWDCECIAESEGAAQALAEAVLALDCAKGTFGDGRVQLLLVEDQSDDYVPRGIPSDSGWTVCAFSLTVFGYVAGDASSSSSSSSPSSESSEVPN